MPFDLRDYPPDWDAIAEEAKRRAGYRCEHCGAVQYAPTTNRHGAARRVILTAAHVHGERTDDPDARLIALCAPCHLRYDARLHVRSRKQRERAAAKAAGQQALWDEES